MIEIDLRPPTIRYRAEGLARLEALTFTAKRLTSIVVPLALAVVYLRYWTVAIEDDKENLETKLRQEHAGAAELANRNRLEARKISRERQAFELALARVMVLSALVSAAIPEVSLSELSVSESTVVLKGEVADVSTLQSFLSEVTQSAGAARVAVESLREELSEEQHRHARFIARMFLAGRAENAGRE